MARVEIGLASIKGFNGSHSLSVPLLNLLQSIDLFSQNHSSVQNGPYLDSISWLAARVIGLISYRMGGLYSTAATCGYLFVAREDVLSWNGCCKKGQLQVKEVYNYILQGSCKKGPNAFWFHKSWNWDIPLKLKCFVWLAAHNKMLMCYNFLEKEFHGPGSALAMRLIASFPVLL